MLAAMALCVLVALALAYRWYGKAVARSYALDDGRRTPAREREDGVDFVPARPFYLMGQHFSAISAAGPIAGPILACQAFGWAPCLIWIVVGVVFVGAVHDFSALVASVRHGAKSVAEIVRQHIGSRAWVAMLLFIWMALNYVIVAFTDITANTFLGTTEELAGGAFRFNPGGAVAAASAMYLALALLMGAIRRRFAPPLWLLTVIFVPATLSVVWLGTQMSTVFALEGMHPARLWGVSILAYCFIASLLPVWLLLQPRGYLGGFVLYVTLAVGVVGIFLGNLRFPGQFDVVQPAFKGFDSGGATGLLFPFLFVTIACGACSGFHGLVCSGTTSKQLERESHARPVGYGSMLLEAFVALIAMGTIMTFAQQEHMPGPGRIFGDGIGRSLAVVIGPENRVFAMTFGAVAFSTFIFDTLDVSTRLGRYVVQELTGLRGRAGGVLATLATLAIPLLVLALSPPPVPGQRPAYLDFWTLFGTSNQLLAALTLLGITVWLYRSGRRIRYTVFPMLFVLAVTLTALVLQVRAAAAAVLRAGFSGAPLANAVAGTLLCILALFLIVEGAAVIRDVRARRADEGAPAG